MLTDGSRGPHWRVREPRLAHPSSYLGTQVHQCVAGQLSLAPSKEAKWPIDEMTRHVVECLEVVGKGGEADRSGELLDHKVPWATRQDRRLAHGFENEDLDQDQAQSIRAARI